MDLALHTTAKDLALLVLELNLLAKFTIGGHDVQCEQWMEKLGHFSILSLCNLEFQNTIVVQGYVPVLRRNNHLKWDTLEAAF